MNEQLMKLALDSLGMLFKAEWPFMVAVVFLLLVGRRSNGRRAARELTRICKQLAAVSRSLRAAAHSGGCCQRGRGRRVACPATCPRLGPPALARRMSPRKRSNLPTKNNQYPNCFNGMEVPLE